MKKFLNASKKYKYKTYLLFGKGFKSSNQKATIRAIKSRGIKIRKRPAIFNSAGDKSISAYVADCDKIIPKRNFKRFIVLTNLPIKMNLMQVDRQRVHKESGFLHVPHGHTPPPWTK